MMSSPNTIVKEQTLWNVPKMKVLLELGFTTYVPTSHVQHLPLLSQLKESNSQSNCEAGGKGDVLLNIATLESGIEIT